MSVDVGAVACATVVLTTLASIVYESEVTSVVVCWVGVVSVSTTLACSLSEAVFSPCDRSDCYYFGKVVYATVCT